MHKLIIKQLVKKHFKSSRYMNQVTERAKNEFILQYHREQFCRKYLQLYLDQAYYLIERQEAMAQLMNRTQFQLEESENECVTPEVQDDEQYTNGEW